MKLVTGNYKFNLSSLYKVEYYISDVLLNTIFIDHYGLNRFDRIINEGVVSYNYIVDESLSNMRYIDNSSAQGVFNLNDGNYVLKLIIDYNVTGLIGYDVVGNIVLICENETNNEWNDKLNSITNQPNNYVINEKNFRRILVIKSGDLSKYSDATIHENLIKAHSQDLIITLFDSMEYNTINKYFLDMLGNLEISDISSNSDFGIKILPTCSKYIYRR